MMRYFRMRMRILSLPSCPDWRKVRVGNSDKMGDKLPSEGEMERIALDKLKLRRQQSLAQRHIELIRLRQELSAQSMAEMNTVTTMDFLTPPDLEEEMRPSPVFRRSARSQSISFNNLSELNNVHPRKMESTVQKRALNVSSDEMIHVQRAKRLKELREQLDEFAALHNAKGDSSVIDDNESGGLSQFNGDLFAQRFRGSNLSLVSLDGIENSKAIPEISYRLQKMREKELIKARKANHVLEYKLKKQFSEGML